MSDHSAILGEEAGNVEYFDIEKREAKSSAAYRDVVPIRYISSKEFAKNFIK